MTFNIHDQINRTQNDEIIRAILRGEQVEVNSMYDENEWTVFDINDFLEGQKFGPWNCHNAYKWRIKKKVVTKEITLKKVIVETVKLDFEDVKTSFYKIGDSVHYISNLKVKPILTTNYRVEHNQEQESDNVIYFNTAEAAEQAYQKILDAQKGL